jgi:hypothetical protein
MNRRHVLALAVFALAGAMLFPTMAAPSGDADTVAGTDIVLEPYGGPNGAYAVMYDQDGDGTDELGLDFSATNSAVEGDGVNAGTVTPVHRVFTITYTGEQAAEVYLTDGTDDITFYREDDPDESLEGAENAVELGPEESVAVGVLIDATDGTNVENVDGFTVHANVTEPGDVETASEPTTTEATTTETDTTTTETETTTETDDGGGGGGGTGETNIQSLPTPTDTPTSDDDEGSATDTTTTATTTTDTEPSGTGTNGETAVNTTTVTAAEPPGTTTTDGAFTAANPARDTDTGQRASLVLGEIPWWLVLLILLLATSTAGLWYYATGE